MGKGSSHRTAGLLLQQAFDEGDADFLERLRAPHPPGPLASLADTWKKDPRPWAREQLLAYLDGPIDVPGHRPLVKRLFKQAEDDGDDELLAAFLVAFDRLVRRVKRTAHRYDWNTRTAWKEEWLALPKPPRGAEESFGRFSYHTRYYLRRRAWRRFRRAGFQRPDEYPGLVARVLRRYRDEDTAKGAELLERWGLLHIAFRRSEALRFEASRVRLRDGAGLSGLEAAPAFPELWRSDAARTELLGLVSDAPARLVRLLAMDLLRREHAAALTQLAPAEITPLLSHADQEVQAFGAELFEGASGLEQLSVRAWLELLDTSAPAAIEALCRAMAKHVRADRLELRACVDLACAAPAAVASMGLELLRQKEVRTADERRLLARTADTRCASAARDLAEHGLSILGAEDVYETDLALPFFDSLQPGARAAALDWLTPEVPASNDPLLFSRLVETPFEDVRLRLVQLLEQRSKLPGVGADRLVPVWASVLLGVQRGGRRKLDAIRQLAGALEREPARSGELLPVLVVAVRSIRAPEARAGLAAIVRLVAARPELEPTIREALPELSLTAEGAA